MVHFLNLSNCAIWKFAIYFLACISWWTAGFYYPKLEMRPYHWFEEVWW